MGFDAGHNRVYLVPFITIGRPDNTPTSNTREEEKHVLHLRQLIQIMGDLTDNRFVLALNAGTEMHYRQELLATYQQMVHAGSELAMQLSHQILAGVSEEAQYRMWSTQLQAGKERLERMGIAPTACRIADHAWPAFMPRLLAEQELMADYSCFPGLNQPERHNVWPREQFSADYLPVDIRSPWHSQPCSRILTIPLGSDGLGTQDINTLNIEKSDLNNLSRIWDTLIARAETAGKCQIVHCLFQSSSVAVPAWLDRWQRFLSFVPERQGQFITSVDAQALQERFNREFIK